MKNGERRKHIQFRLCSLLMKTSVQQIAKPVKITRELKWLMIALLLNYTSLRINMLLFCSIDNRRGRQRLHFATGFLNAMNTASQTRSSSFKGFSCSC